MRSPSHPICQQTDRLISSNFTPLSPLLPPWWESRVLPTAGPPLRVPTWLLASCPAVALSQLGGSAAPNQPGRKVVSATTWVSTYLTPPLSQLLLSDMRGIKLVANPSCRARRWSQEWHQGDVGDFGGVLLPGWLSMTGSVCFLYTKAKQSKQINKPKKTQNKQNYSCSDLRHYIATNKLREHYHFPGWDVFPLNSYLNPESHIYSKPSVKSKTMCSS